MVIASDDEGHKCDERCYNAKRMDCSCICGGVNHGHGLEHALKNAGYDEDFIDEVMGRKKEEKAPGAVEIDEHGHRSFNESDVPR